MRTRPAFEDVLDATLREPAFTSRDQSWSARTGTAAAYGFFFGTGPLANTSPDAASPTSRSAAVDARYAGAVSPAGSGSRPFGCPLAGSAEPAPRPRRRLAAPQRQALAELVALGARLGDDFTAAELRSAFRALARHYHPDRHTTASASAREVFARQFARVHDAYRLLSES
jgi:hypothetical protein